MSINKSIRKIRRNIVSDEITLHFKSSFNHVDQTALEQFYLQTPYTTIDNTKLVHNNEIVIFQESRKYPGVTVNDIRFFLSCTINCWYTP